LQSGASGDPALVLLELRSETGLSIARGASGFDYLSIGAKLSLITCSALVFALARSSEKMSVDALECGYLRRYPMKAAAYPLLLATVLGFSAAQASAQVTPGDPAGNQTIPEKYRSGHKIIPHRSFHRRELRVARQVWSQNDKVPGAVLRRAPPDFLGERHPRIAKTRHEGGLRCRGFRHWRCS
jgi:hypothetical protein